MLLSSIFARKAPQVAPACSGTRKSGNTWRITHTKFGAPREMTLALDLDPRELAKYGLALSDEGVLSGPKVSLDLRGDRVPNARVALALVDPLRGTFALRYRDAAGERTSAFSARDLGGVDPLDAARGRDRGDAPIAAQEVAFGRERPAAGGITRTGGTTKTSLPSGRSGPERLETWQIPAEHFGAGKRTALTLAGDLAALFGRFGATLSDEGVLSSPAWSEPIDLRGGKTFNKAVTLSIDDADRGVLRVTFQEIGKPRQTTTLRL